MTEYAELAARLDKALALTTGPVAIRLNAAVAEGTTPATPVAAGCAFWEIGASRTVGTRAADHAHRREDVAQGRMPRVKESLARLS